MIHRILCAALVAPFLTSVASAAGTRTVRVQNEMTALIDVGFLQPPSSTTLSTYGTLHAKTVQSFKLDEGDARIVVKSSACHGSSYAPVPQRATTVVIESGCRLVVK
jgi:hypothetical protein